MSGGDVFPDGEVPIQSTIAQSATLEGIDGTERVFFVDWKEHETEELEIITVTFTRKKLEKNHSTNESEKQ